MFNQRFRLGFNTSDRNTMITAMLTPPHAAFQTGMAVPMYLRYEGGHPVRVPHGAQQ
jgi:hypothetical protein